MNIRIVPYTQEYEAGVRAFNARLAAANLDQAVYSGHFAERHVPVWLPKRPGCDLYQEYFVAVDSESVVHGAYSLKHQAFLVGGDLLRLAHYQLPISEGIIDSRFTTVAVKLFVDAIRRQPCLFGLGGGGYHLPVVRFLIAAGCQPATVPFYYRVIHTRPFLRNLEVLRAFGVLRVALDGLAWSGLGWLGIQATQVLKGTHRPLAAITCECVEEFTEWADEVWNNCKEFYSLIAVRDRQILNVLYPRSDLRFFRLKVMRQGKVIGWAVLLSSHMVGHKHFGNMHVGTLVDCLAAPEDATDVVACARDVLETDGVDLIVSNQCSLAWCRALSACGFLRGPSNFPFLAAPQLAASLHPFKENSKTFHLNRGDGDGPIHLW